MESKCARCGKDPADGFAAIDDKRYCHKAAPSCYELAQWDEDPVRPYPMFEDGHYGDHLG